MAQVEKKLFFDSNQLFTAAYNPNGLASGVIGNHKKLKVGLVTSVYAIEEARHNLGLKAPEAAQIQFEKILRQFEIVDVPIREDFNPLNLPLDDVPIFQGALESGATHLITGDKKAFGAWMNKSKKTMGLVIQTMRMFVDELSQ